MLLTSQQLAGRGAAVLRTRSGPAQYAIRVGDAVVSRASGTSGDMFSLADRESGEFCICDGAFRSQLSEAIGKILGMVPQPTSRIRAGIRADTRPANRTVEVGDALVYRSAGTYGDVFSLADRRSCIFCHCGEDFLSQLGRALG
ncbi:MAG: hypothetical protein GY842_09060 [bacterium]|nr:hypothetical protein [bacterium]